MINLVSFSDSQYRKAQHRLQVQAKNSNFFDSINLIDENKLSQTFRIKHKDILCNSTRGYGYWIWKPKIILDEMRALKKGDILVYVDVGCHINVYGKQRFLEYVQAVKNSPSGILCFSPSKDLLKNININYSYPEYLNCEWTKGDLLNRLNLNEDKIFLNKPQLIAGIIIIQVNSISLGVIEEWLNICEEDYSFINDVVSTNPNPGEFIQHRHDQSVLNCVLYKNGIDPVNISYYETWPGFPNPGVMEGWDRLKLMPFHARRDTARYKIDVLRSMIKKIL